MSINDFLLSKKLFSLSRCCVIGVFPFLLVGCGSNSSKPISPPTEVSSCAPYAADTNYRTWNSNTCNFDLNESLSKSLYEDSSYNNTNFLAYHNASNAWARDITGSGVKVAVVDTGIKDVSSAGKNVIASSSFIPDSGEIVNGHGTAVASIIAGSGIGTSLGQGIAFDADLIDARACDSSGSCQSASVSTAGKWAIGQGADIINLSLAGSGWSFLSFQSSARDNDVLLVWAAGNDDDALSPARTAASCLIDSTLCETNLVVGGVIVPKDSTTGELDLTRAISKGNKAGDLKNHFLVASYTTGIEKLDGTSGIMSGTSFSTPAVSATAALVKERHPHLSSGEVKSILLESATDLGEVGVDDVFGHGLLNIKGAMAPLGDFGFTRSLNSNSPARTGGGIITSNVVMKEFEVASTTAFDQYGRDYAISNTDLTKQAIKAATVNTLNVSELHSQKEFESSIKSGLVELGVSPKKKGVKAQVASGIKVGLFQETDTFLGSEFKGLFGNINTTSATVEVEKHLIRGSNSYVKANAQAKASTATGSASFTKSMNAMAVDLGVEGGFTLNGYLLKGSIALPNNVVAGKATFDLPQGRTLEGEVISESVTSDITSDVSPVLSASVETNLRSNIKFQIGAKKTIDDVGLGIGLIQHW